jgi:uncharacterized 2Fe-2S/4Fe-4S cluster protein (DUF4445 family)
MGVTLGELEGRLATLYPVGTAAELRRVLEAARRHGIRVRLEGGGPAQVGWISRHPETRQAALLRQRDHRKGVALRTAGVERVYRMDGARPGLVYGSRPR